MNGLSIKQSLSNNPTFCTVIVYLKYLLTTILTFAMMIIIPILDSQVEWEMKNTVKKEEL